MKKYIYLSSIALAGLLSACNDDYVDKFDIDYNPTDVKSINLTLSPSDYASIASNATNQEIALAKDPETQVFVEALNAVKNNKYFTENAPADEYIPALLAGRYPNADLGSKFNVTYNVYQEPSAYLNELSYIADYSLTKEDYKSVWGTKVEANFLTPSTTDKIPAILSANVKDAQNGDMLLVNYAYSATEPSIGGGTVEPVEPAKVYDKIGDVAAAAAGEHEVKGEVIATNARGFLMSDGTGTIMVYQNTTSNYSVGDSVIVKGTTSKYSGFMQFPKEATITRTGRAATFTYPTPTTMTGADIEAWAAKAEIKYVKVTGKYTQSGTYYNLAIDGTTAHAGSIQYPVAGLFTEEMKDKDVDITGYLCGYSSKYAYFMVTSVAEAGTTDAFVPVSNVLYGANEEYNIRGVVAAKYARGFLLTDGTGNVLVYKSGGYEVNVGDEVTVKGKSSDYAGLKQFSSPTVEVLKTGGKFTLPAAQELSAEDVAAYVEAPYCALVKYTGTLNISGSYYNVVIDGTTVQGSLAYVLADAVPADLNGKKITVTGYAIGQTSSKKYLNTMITSVEETTTSASAKMLAPAQGEVANTDAALYTFNGTAWAPYTNDNANIAVFGPQDYEALGNNVVTAPEYVLPIFLEKKYPYAEAGTKAAVIYKSSKGLTATEFTFNNLYAWEETPLSTTETTTFSVDKDGISANLSIYISDTFLGTTGGFTVQDVTLNGLTYVWSNTAAYGWKATAYVNKTNCESESWIVSPALNFKKAKQPILTFEEAHKYLNGADPTVYFGILISTDYKDDVTKCTWTDLTADAQNWSDGSTWDYVNVGQIDLSKFVGGKAVVAIRYKSDAAAAATLEIKNFKVVEASALTE